MYDNYLMLLIWFILVGYVTSQCNIPHTKVDPECEGSLPEVCSPARLFGGVDIQKERFPYLVSLQKSLQPINSEWSLYYEHFCGATLIANRVLLTAAHCLWATQTYDWRSARAGTGVPTEEIFSAIAPYCRHMRGKGRFRVKEYYIHPGYEGSPQGGNDIAVLVLEQGLDYQGEIANYRASSKLSPNELTNMTIIGWGVTSPTEVFQFQQSVIPAQQAKVSFMESKQCANLTNQRNSAYIIDEDKMICGLNGNADTCTGDSGGPLLYLGLDGNLNYQVGVTSWGPDGSCTNLRGGSPGVYTKVQNYVEWLDETLAEIQINYPELQEAIDQVLLDGRQIQKQISLEVSPECLLQVDFGFGEANIPSFYFDASTGQCVEFISSGKGGNKNNFATQQQCETTCQSPKK